VFANLFGGFVVLFAVFAEGFSGVKTPRILDLDDLTSDAALMN
jgi:hypothetical protein